MILCTKKTEMVSSLHQVAAILSLSRGYCVIIRSSSFHKTVVALPYDLSAPTPDRRRLVSYSKESTVNYRLAAFVAATAAAGLLTAGSASARDQVKIAGSSTVFPYAKIVAENFAKANSTLKAPVVESGGSGAGIKQFCDGVGEDKIDIANSSRRIKKSEQETCAKNGVADIVEVKFGYDGIVFASDVKGPSFAFEPKDWFLAIGAEVPVNGALAANPNKTWKQVNPNFPDWDIVAYIPGEKHGTREVFETKVLVAGCKAAGADKLIEEKLKASGTPADKLGEATEKACAKVRKDDGGKHAVDIDGDYTENSGPPPEQQAGAWRFRSLFLREQYR